MQALGFGFLAVLGWAVFTLLLRGALEVLPVGLAGFLSRIVTLAVLGGWVFAAGDRWRRMRPRGKGWWLLMMGGLSIFINLLWFASLRWTPATNVALLFRLDLVFVVIIGAALGLERIGGKQLMLLPVMLVGLALVIEINRIDWGGHLAGDLMVVVASLGFAVNAFVIRHILQVMDEGAVSLYNHAMSTFGFLGLAIFKDEFRLLPELAARPVTWFWIVAIGLTAAVSLPLYYAALRRMPVWKLRTLMLSAPLVVAAVEWSVWGLEFSLSQILGAAIVLVGLAVLIRVERHVPAVNEH